MAITKVGAMTDPPVAGDYTILQAKLDAYAKQIGNQGMILTQWVNTTTTPAIALGSYITHGGTLFVVDTEDFAVTEPAGNGTYYLKVAVSGDTLAVSWVASTAGYAWNSIYNGLYHSDESQILPYQLVKSGALVEKYKITNLMQGGGFSRVRYDGAVKCESLAVTGAIIDKNGREVLSLKTEIQTATFSHIISGFTTGTLTFSSDILGIADITIGTKEGEPFSSGSRDVNVFSYTITGDTLSYNVASLGGETKRITCTAFI